MILQIEDKNEDSNAIIFNVLLVEDNEDWLSILEDFVKDSIQQIGHENSTIKAVTKYGDARKLISEYKWNLLVTDIGLGNNAQQLGRRLIEQAYALNIPVIAVSGTPIVTTKNVRDILKEDGAVDYFSKSEFDSEEFNELFIDLRGSTDKELNILQRNVATNLAIKAKNNSGFKIKLTKWIDSLGDTATKAFISEGIKEIFILTLKILGGA
jgi:CheY-like chemotaxis protein